MVEPVELGQAANNGVAPRAHRRQGMGQRAPLVAHLGGTRAALGERGGGGFLRRECAGHRLLERGDGARGLAGLGGGGGGEAIGVGPAAIQQARLGGADAVAQVAIAFGGARLAAEGHCAGFVIA